MRKVVIIFSVLLICFFISCDLFGGSDSESSYYIEVYSDSSKSIDNPVPVYIASENADAAVYEKICKSVTGKITKLSFHNIANVSWVYGSATDISLTEVMFDSAIKTIGEKAFYSAEKIAKIYFESVPQTVENTAFYDSGFHVIVPLRIANECKTKFEKFSNAEIRVKIKVSFDANKTGFSRISTPKNVEPSITVTTEEKLNPVRVPVSEGWIFCGYFTSSTDKEGVKVFNKDGTPVTNTDYVSDDGKWIKEADVTLYAHWQKEPDWVLASTDVNVDYNKSKFPAIINLVSDVKQTIISRNATSVNRDILESTDRYVISGFYVEEECKTMIIDGNANVVSGTVEGYVKDGKWAYTGDVFPLRIYASWTDANFYTITLDSNGGDKSGSVKVCIGTALLQDFAQATKKGKSVDYYSYKQNDTGEPEKYAVIADGHLCPKVAEYTDENSNWIRTTNTTLYAVWASANVDPDVTGGGK